MSADRPDLSPISAAASEAQASLAALPSGDRLTALEERLASLEVVQEDFAKRDLAYTEIAEYVRDLRGDLKDTRRARTIYGGAALLIVGLLLSLLLGLVFDPHTPVNRLPQYPAAILLVGILTGAVVILLTLARNAHRLPTEKQAEETSLPQVEFLTQLMKSLRG